MTNDPALEALVKGSLADGSIQLTLLVNGQCIVGTLVTATAYREGSQIGPTSYPASDNGYIHLRDASIIGFNKETASLGWFRCRIDAVQGFALQKQHASAAVHPSDDSSTQQSS